MKALVSQTEAPKGNDTAHPVKTEFEKNMAEGKKFWLGPIVRSHKIGEYQFIEYRETDFGIASKTYGRLTGNTNFSCYINGLGTSQSAESLDAALAHVIAYKHDGCNSRAAGYFMKMIANEEAKTV